MSDVWFSTSLRIGIFLEKEGLTSINRSVVLFKAADFDQAFKQALTIGKNFETSYENDLGESVKWRLISVETIDQLGDSITEEREVYSEMISPNIPMDFDTDLKPELSQPTQSGI